MYAYVYTCVYVRSIFQVVIESIGRAVAGSRGSLVFLKLHLYACLGRRKRSPLMADRLLVRFAGNTRGIRITRKVSFIGSAENGRETAMRCIRG